MKTLNPYFAAALGGLLFTANICKAQTISLKPAPANVTIDGSLAEWGDSLSYYNPSTQLNYTLANDNNNLYLVLKTNDPMEQQRILTAGITFGIDPAGRKKSAYNVTFPFAEQDNKGLIDAYTDQEQKLEVSLTKLKRIKADGFKDVESDVFTLENTYGFRVAINYDAHGFLVYEETIPLALFHADQQKKNEWSFNIKINDSRAFMKKEGGEQAAAPAPGMGGGRGGMGGGGGRRGGGGGMGGGGRGGRGETGGYTESSHGTSSKELDFSGKFILTKA